MDLTNIEGIERLECITVFTEVGFHFVVFTGLPVWQSQSESGWDLFVLFLLGCRMAIPVGKWIDFSVVFILFFSVSVKVLPVTPLLSGVFVHRAFCAYFLRIERVVGNA